MRIFFVFIFYDDMKSMAITCFYMVKEAWEMD